MTGRTHDVAAFTALTAIFVLMPQVPTMSLATAVAAFGANFIGGLFPDIDQTTSDFWDNFRLGPFIAKLICPALGGHRHISHSFLGLLIIGFGSHFFLNLLAKIVLIDMNIVWHAFMIGVISHLLADLPTKAGVPLLWPLNFKFGFPPIKALRFESGTFIENYIIFPALLLLSGWMLFTHQTRVLEFFHHYLR